MIKAEMNNNGEKGILTLNFECNKESDHEALDAIRVAIMGDHIKRGMYENSNKLVIEIRTKDNV